MAVGRVIAVLVASGAGQRDGGQFLARAAARAVDGQEHQAAFFDRAHGVVLAGQAGQKVKIAFVGLVDVRHLDGGQGGVYARGQVVAPRDGVHGGVVPAALAAGAQLECIKKPAKCGLLGKGSATPCARKANHGHDGCQHDQRPLRQGGDARSARSARGHTELNVPR